MTKPRVNLDAPVYETVYNVITSAGSIVVVFTDRESAQRYATAHGLRIAKTVRVLEE